MHDHDAERVSAPSKSKQLSFKNMFRWGIGTLLVVFVAIQFIPVEKTNPPVDGDVPTSPQVKVVLRQACYDCHSNETAWPWYTNVAPASWLAAKDVNEGRQHLNFSTWNSYDTKKQMEMMHETWEEVEEGEMPPWCYTPMHRDARLSTEDKKLLRTWALGSHGPIQAGKNEHESDED